MQYIKVFDEIVDIMHKDYSGCNDKRGLDNPELYRNQIQKLIDERRISKRKFLDIAWQYLFAFKDHHVFLGMDGVAEKFYGIQVRRYEDKLYIEKSCTDNLPVGMVIQKLGRDSIEQAYAKHKHYFFETIAERENWQRVLLKYNSCTVLTKSAVTQKKEFKNITDYHSNKPKYCAEKLNAETLLIKLLDFADGDAIAKLINDNTTALKTSKNLIIDVRYNGGGSDIAFFPLLEYIFQPQDELDSYDYCDGYLATVNCSKRNCDNRIKLLNDVLNGNSDILNLNEEGIKNYLLSMIEFFKENCGKGFVEDVTDKDAAGSGFLINKLSGSVMPQRVIILSDVYCGSSGDAFVEICKKSEKVTVIGRPTLGSTDYSNLAQEKIDKITLLYPTSRDNRIDSGKGLNGKGVQPNIYIPWTPLHLEKDIDLEYALEFLAKC